MRLFGSIRSLSSPGVEDPDVEQLRQARLVAARRNTRWREVEEAALVRRAPSFLVDADSDALYLPYRGAVWVTGSITPIRDYAPLVFYVDGERRARLPRTPAGQLERRRRYTRAAPEGAAMSHTALLRFTPAYDTRHLVDDPAGAPELMVSPDALHKVRPTSRHPSSSTTTSTASSATCATSTWRKTSTTARGSGSGGSPPARSPTRPAGSNAEVA